MKVTPFGVGLVALLVAPAAMAQSAHFITATGAVTTDGGYVANWKEAGLGNCPPSGACTYDLEAIAQSTWQCFNNGNNKPQGAPNSGGPSVVFTGGAFPPSHNGSITASLTLSPTSDSVACQGGGLKLCLVGVSYSSVTLTDVTFNDIVSLPGGNVEIAPPSGTSAGTCINQ